MSLRSESPPTAEDALNLAGATLDGVASVSIGKAALKQLSSLGHVISRFLESRKVLLKQVEKRPDEFAALTTWLKKPESAGSSIKVLEGEGLFASLFSWNDKGFSAKALLVDQASLSNALGVLELNGNTLEVPEDANASIWPAILRQGMLKAFWEQEMRKNLYEALCLVLPDAWVLDPAPLPKGSVIPRLELADWEEFSTSDLDESLNFAVASTWEAPSVFGKATSLSLTSSLASFPSEVSTLTAHLADLESLTVLAVYEKKNGKTNLVKVVQINHNSQGGKTLIPVIA